MSERYSGEHVLSRQQAHGVCRRGRRRICCSGQRSGVLRRRTGWRATPTLAPPLLATQCRLPMPWCGRVHSNMFLSKCGCTALMMAAARGAMHHGMLSSPVVEPVKLCEVPAVISTRAPRG